MKYEYDFVKIDLKLIGKVPKQDYHDIISDYAADGWRFVQVFAPGVASYGAASHYELIFERELK